ncbi:hypothetical protein [Rhodopila sp.]|nr:hypothetical protein [Rhodopila sp.]
MSAWQTAATISLSIILTVFLGQFGNSSSLNDGRADLIRLTFYAGKF